MAAALSSAVGVQCRRMRPCTFHSGLSSVGTVAVPQLGKSSFVRLCPHPHAWMATLSPREKTLQCPAAPSWAVTSTLHTAPTWASTVRGPLLPPLPAPMASSFLSLLRLQPTSPRGLLRMDTCLAVSSFGLGGVRNSGLEVVPLWVSSFCVCCQLQPFFWYFVTFPLWSPRGSCLSPEPTV